MCDGCRLHEGRTLTMVGWIDGWIGYLCKQPLVSAHSPDNVWLQRLLLLHLFRVSFIVFSLQISFCICVIGSGNGIIVIIIIIIATSLGVERAWHALLSLPRDVAHSLT